MTKKLGCSLLILLFLFIASTIAYSYDVEISRQFRISKDVQTEWILFDRKHDAYMLYNPFLHRDHSPKILFISSDLLRENNLYLYLTGNTYLFVNGKVVYKKITEGWLELTYTYLKNSQKGGLSFISIYSPHDAHAVKYSFYGYRYSVNRLHFNQSQPLDSLKNNSLYAQRNFLGLSFLFILFCLAIFKQRNHSLYNGFYTFSYLFKTGAVDFFYKKPLSISGYYLFFIGIMMAFLSLSLLGGNLSFIPYPIEKIAHWGWPKLAYFLISSLGISFLYFFRFIFIKFFSKLFNITPWAYQHYFYLVKASITFYILLLCFSLTVYFLHINFSTHVIHFFIVLFLIFRSLIILFFLNRWQPIRNLYLFSYLCITEWVPLLISVRLGLFF